MKNIIHKSIGLALCVLIVTAFPNNSFAAPHHYIAPGTSLNLNITSEMISNLSGGLAQGTTSDTLVDASLGLGTQKFGLWNGGWLWIEGQHINSGNPSERLVGDWQGVSNIAATPGNRIYQLWYRQYIGDTNLKLRGGVIDLNNYFAVIPHADQLSNASLGLAPIISTNAPTSTYEKPGAGLIVSDGKGNWGGSFGIFQGHPGHRNQIFNHGYMAIGEIVNQTPTWSNPTTITKLGLWQYSQPDPVADGGPGSTWGGYAILAHDADPVMGSHATHLFAQFGFSPPMASATPYYFGAGIALDGPWSLNPQDRLSASVSRATVRQTAGMGSETSYELNYLWNVSQIVSLQPDIQYIMRPLGTPDQPLPDALVVMIRLNLALGM